MFQIEYANKFIRRFKKLPKDIQEKYAKKEDILRDDPFSVLLRTHKLHGHLKQCWAFSVDQQYRVLFIFQGKSIVMMLTIGDHGIYNDIL